MALTKSYHDAVIDRARRDPAFRAALLEEAAQNLLDGELEIARSQLRKCAHALATFDVLAATTNIPKPSLMRMLGPSGNPRAENLLAILRALQSHAGVALQVSSRQLEPAA
ncbi:helix-turn-helix domain-containing transcriptional regulator [Sabulicella glaciei]|uniref:Transcriptional regulator n=1 Tax=Sabulicella glaciei TaxID=2984948 RepID=A0ABT3NZM3_9PROT|nr:transcriptional regulator [Roseococcus sp. MDT2-1-1]MCW8087606.1 transcriptional regulator [Roseococcus sp. MDT2-1-1]